LRPNAFALAEPWGFSPALRQRLIQRIEAALGSKEA